MRHGARVPDAYLPEYRRDLRALWHHTLEHAREAAGLDHAAVLAHQRATGTLLGSPETEAELEKAEAAVTTAEHDLAAAKRFIPSTLIPRLRERWQDAIAALAQRSCDIPKARAAIRELLGEQIIVRNEKGDLIAEIASSSDAQITVVAGAGFEPATFGL